MEQSRITHIIWDWNGTLLDDAWLCVDVMNGMLAERGLPLRSVSEYRELFDFPVRNYYEKIGWDFSMESFDVVGLEFITRYNLRHFEASLHPGVFGVLERFRELGFSQNILSAREQGELEAETKKLQVGHFFDRIRGLDDHYAHGKTEAGLRLMEELRIPPQGVLFIGDTCHDAEVAEEMGVTCILIPNGHHSESRLRSTGRTVVDSLEKVVDQVS